MNLDGKLEGMAVKTHLETGDEYRRLVMKGRVFLTFDSGVIAKCDGIEKGEYCVMTYEYGPMEWGPNVYRLVDIVAK